MGNLSQAKTLGGIGSILTLLLLVPGNIGAVLVIVGWILILVAVKRIADEAHDSSIFNNALIAAILAILGIIVFVVIIAAAFLSLIGLGGLSSAGTTTPPASVIGAILSVLAGLAVAWIIGVVGSFFLWRSFKGVGDRSRVNLFKTAGLVYFIGSILTIILVGFIVIFIAQILFVAAFFSLPDDMPQAPMAQPQSMGMGPVSQFRAWASRRRPSEGSRTLASS